MTGANHAKKNKKKGKEEQFEFCKVCRLNHSNGRKHIYFPNHAKSLSAFLSRFSKKITDVQSFLKRPYFLSPEHAAKNGFWCVFCDVDVSEKGSTFACETAIKHLACDDHLENVKSFMWKHGGKKEEIDFYRIKESDVIKWQNGCEALMKSLPAEVSSIESTSLQSNDIQPTQISVHKDFLYSSVNFCNDSSVSNGVIPLQYYTNKSQISSSGCNNGVGFLPSSSHANSNASFRSGSSGVQVGEWNSWSNTTQVVHGLSQLPHVPNKGAVANVHTGAPPPWLDSNDHIEFMAGASGFGKVNELGSEPLKKKSKLNPKRVGAAWAERRKIELEREKRGEAVSSHGGEDWLPNFGRVWQSGSRKESRKEFDTEKIRQKKSKQIHLPEISSVTVQPYVSKRMRAEKNQSAQDSRDLSK